MPRQHLMLGAEIRPQAKKRIINHEPVIADDHRGAPDRVHAGEIALWNEAQRACGGLARGKAWCGKDSPRSGEE